MTALPFNSLGGFSSGIPAVTIVDANGNVTTNVLTSGNVAANVVYASHYKYANGNPIAAGSNTQIQFMNGSNFFAASANLTFNNSTNTLTVNGPILSNSSQLGIGNYQFKSNQVVIEQTTSNSASQELYSVAIANISGVDIHVIAIDANSNARQSHKFESLVSNTANISETSTLSVNGGIGNIDFALVSSNLVLSASPSSGNTIDYKILITTYPE